LKPVVFEHGLHRQIVLMRVHLNAANTSFGTKAFGQFDESGGQPPAPVPVGDGDAVNDGVLAVAQPPAVVDAVIDIFFLKRNDSRRGDDAVHGQHIAFFAFDVLPDDVAVRVAVLPLADTGAAEVRLRLLDDVHNGVDIRRFGFS